MEKRHWRARCFICAGACLVAAPAVARAQASSSEDASESTPIAETAEPGQQGAGPQQSAAEDSAAQHQQAPSGSRAAHAQVDPHGKPNAAGDWHSGADGADSADAIAEQDAEEAAVLEMDLGELIGLQMQVVSASGIPERLAEVPSNMEIVTAQQIQEWGARDIKDVLRHLSGFPVVADRDEWVFAVRGNVGDNNQKYLILVDGRRLNSAENFGPGQIIEMPNDLSNVKRVEIIRGPGSVVWGSDALAGVINIITRDASDLQGANYEARVTLGSNAMVRVSATAAEQLAKDVDVIVHGCKSETDCVCHYAASANRGCS